MKATLLTRPCGLFLISLLCLAASVPVLAIPVHGPAVATIHPRGDYITVEYSGNGLDLTISADWKDYQKGDNGLYVQPSSALVAAYIAKTIQISRGGHPLVGRLVFQRQKCPTDPATSTFHAVVEYRDPLNLPPTGPLTIVSSLFGTQAQPDVRFELGADSIQAHTGIPITFPASEVELTPQHVLTDSIGTGLWAALDGTTVLLLLLLYSPLSGIKPMGQAWLRFAAGLAVGAVVAGFCHIPLDEFTGRCVMVTVVVAVALINLAGSRVGLRAIVDAAAGLLAGAAMSFPLAEFGLPSRLSALAVGSNTLGALVGIIACGVGVAIVVVLGEREAQRRSRIDPKALANLRLIVNIVSVLAVGYLAFRL